MGVFNFLRSAGEKLGIVGPSEEEKQAQAEAQAIAAEAAEQARNASIEAHLRATIDQLVTISDLKLAHDDGKVTVWGTTETAADREKVILIIGNTKGIEQVEDHIEVVAPEPEAVFYTVVKGDTLSKIAKAHYGDAMLYPVIFEANKPMLKSPDLIYPGQCLRIPPQETANA